MVGVNNHGMAESLLLLLSISIEEVLKIEKILLLQSRAWEKRQKPKAFHFSKKAVRENRGRVIIPKKVLMGSSLFIKFYLVLYNLGSAIGWAYVLSICYQGYIGGQSAGKLWETLEMPLTYVQTGALMEIFHSLVGIVPSPVFTVFLQVMSRILLVWGVTRPYTAAQAHWSLYQMTISWGLVEVPRYLFYVWAQFPGNIPYPLFWLRYSLFMILYPTGISGEWMQMLFSLKDAEALHPLWYRTTLFIMFVVYTLGGPFMIMNMWKNRKSSFKKRSLASGPGGKDKKVSGLQWPVTNHETGERSTSKTNKAIWSAAMGAVGSASAEKASLDKTKNWRYGYAKHVISSLKVSLRNPNNALDIAMTGLQEAKKLFTVVSKPGKEISLADAVAAAKNSKNTNFVTGVIQGKLKKYTSPKLEIPYGGKDPSQPYYNFKNNDDVLKNDQILKQLEKWVQYGTIEQSCADEIKYVVMNQEKWLDLSDKYFVLIGATSAMGPLDMLLKYGANIIALDIDIERVWNTLISKVRKSSGKMYFPIQKMKANGKTQEEMSDEELAKCSGCNLMEQAPELCSWIQTVCPKEAVTVGNYTYLDGELHVRLSIAADCIIETLCETRKSTSIAFLCTPTDVHVIPQEASDAAKKNAKASPWYQKLISALPGSMLTSNAMKPVQSDSGTDFYYVDGLSIAQGPNYALAKRLQHWRAVVARNKGHTVSSNIAPSTATKSVVSAAMFAAAYGGFHLFKPMEVMYQETSNAVMFALMIHDVVSPNAQASPINAKLENPYQLFEFGSFHGGVWRCGYKLDTIGEVAVLAYLWSKYWFQIIAALGVLSALVYWIVTGVPDSFFVGQIEFFTRFLQILIE